MINPAPDDRELFEGSVAGNRRAFGQIVERYQSLICAITYNLTGDLALSEDLAQETFLAAWQGLRDLREPGKLRAWLCGIARNLCANMVRRRAQDVTHGAEALEQVEEPASPVPSPREVAISAEEQAILWRELENIPEIYREPLILFYRRGRSVKEVAEGLEVSEEAVKQRLSRGRKMLKDQVAAFVENALARTGPKEAFTIAVLAALSAPASSAVAGAAVATAAEGSAAAKAAATASLGGAVLGPLIGLLGAIFGIRASIVNTRSPHERRFMVRMAWVVGVYAALFCGCLFAITFNARAIIAVSPWLLAGSLAGLSGVYIAGLIALIVRSNRRQRQIQIEDGTYVEPRPIHSIVQGQVSKGAVYGSLGGAVFGSVCWLFILSAISKDWYVAAAVLILSIILWYVCTRGALRAPQRYYQIAMAALAGVALLNLAVVNLRWARWMPVYRQSSLYDPMSDWSLWAINALIVGLFACLILLFYIRDRRQRTAAQRPDSGK